jgi:hypothetical protein
VTSPSSATAIGSSTELNEGSLHSVTPRSPLHSKDAPRAVPVLLRSKSHPQVPQCLAGTIMYAGPVSELRAKIVPTESRQSEIVFSIKSAVTRRVPQRILAASNNRLKQTFEILALFGNSLTKYGTYEEERFDYCDRPRKLRVGSSLSIYLLFQGLWRCAGTSVGGAYLVFHEKKFIFESPENPRSGVKNFILGFEIRSSASARTHF